MELLVISHMYPKKTHPTHGIFVHHQARALQEEGLALRVVSPLPWTPFPLPLLSGKWRRYATVPPFQEWEGIPVHYSPYLALPGGLGYARGGERIYRRARPLVDQLHRESPLQLIHAHTALPDGQAALHLSRRLGLPFVVTIHGQDLQQTIHRSPAGERAVAEVIAAAARVFLVSGKLDRLARRHFPQHEDKYRVVPGGIDPRLLFKGESPLARQYR